MNTAEVLKRGIKAKYEQEAASLKAELKVRVFSPMTIIFLNNVLYRRMTINQASKSCLVHLHLLNLI